MLKLDLDEEKKAEDDYEQLLKEEAERLNIRGYQPKVGVLRPRQPKSIYIYMREYRPKSICIYEGVSAKVYIYMREYRPKSIYI